MKPWLTQDNIKRLRFAFQYTRCGVNEWRSVLWSDEVCFEITHRRGSDACDSRYIIHIVKHTDSLMVWCCFAYYGSGTLVFLPKYVRVIQNNHSDLILDNLDDCMTICNANVFMQDGASSHTAKLLKNWFKCCGVKLLEP